MKKIVKSFTFAFNGLKLCFVSEINFKIHLLLAIAALLLGVACSISNTEWLAVTICIAFVTATEMINTAVEKLCDLVQKDFHPGIKKIKDIAAGAVLLAAFCSLVIGVVIFLPKIIVLIKSL
jgi:diacylglycerol kinase